MKIYVCPCEHLSVDWHCCFSTTSNRFFFIFYFPYNSPVRKQKPRPTRAEFEFMCVSEWVCMVINRTGGHVGKLVAYGVGGVWATRCNLDLGPCQETAAVTSTFGCNVTMTADGSKGL